MVFVLVVLRCLVVTGLCVWCVVVLVWCLAFGVVGLWLCCCACLRVVVL